MIPMKFNHILSYVCESPGSTYFKATKVIPPNLNKQAVLVRKANDEDVKAAYR
jgi:hypothetical protein